MELYPFVHQNDTSIFTGAHYIISNSSHFSSNYSGYIVNSFNIFILHSNDWWPTVFVKCTNKYIIIIIKSIHLLKDPQRIWEDIESSEGARSGASEWNGEVMFETPPLHGVREAQTHRDEEKSKSLIYFHRWKSAGWWCWGMLCLFQILIFNNNETPQRTLFKIIFVSNLSMKKAFFGKTVPRIFFTAAAIVRCRLTRLFTH